MSHSVSGQPPSQPSMQSPLGRVRGRGSAKSGHHHWFAQRVTSIALLPLTIWFVFSLASSAGMTYAEALVWIGTPFNAVLLLALIGLTFYHTMLGLQVIIEDYTNSDTVKFALVLGVRAVCWLLALASALAVLRIAV
ncbi:MAG TPA: succinate dehydrogenase, hydrophobic membrane anchor protein [Acetobacteraceae bacterium]|nr:succinate dehydrogenase, hydrophobic membrane anchor protein [Acetobacteraceae bacterium]